jgi:hypothetical protein
LCLSISDCAWDVVIPKMTTSQAQSEIDRHKSTWTEKAALQDLKTYQAHLRSRLTCVYRFRTVLGMWSSQRSWPHVEPGAYPSHCTLSYNVKDMPLVQHVAKIFGMTTSQAQSEIDRQIRTFALFPGIISLVGLKIIPRQGFVRLEVQVGLRPHPKHSPKSIDTSQPGPKRPLCRT